MTPEEMLDYIRCMVVRKEDLSLVEVLSEKNVLEIGEYINDKATATTITNHSPKSRKHPVVTSEVIYSKMVLCQIPFEAEHWHFNRLLMLLQVIDAKSNPKKMTKQEINARNRELNKQRIEELRMKGRCT